MRFAAIPPIPNLRDFESTGIHLCLAHLMNDEEYTKYYRERSDSGDYVILDNGAHENETIEFVELLALGRAIGAKEVVLPDVPHDSILTITHFNTYISMFEYDHELQRLWKVCGSPRLMYVPQVPLVDDALIRFIDLAGYMTRRVLSTTNKDLRFTIGVPLMYEAVAGGLYSLLDRITWLVDDTDIQIHMLGWSRDLTTPIDVAHDFPGVRSCDSAKPFVFAKHGIHMQHAAIQHSMDDLYPGRSDMYFYDPLTPQEIELARYNITFCVTALELGNLPPMPEPASDLSTQNRKD
jgi:hypothetical protein